jgi:protein disulfide-isomerase A1
VESITEFVDNFSGGEMKPSIKSEPVPEKQDGPVTIVVAHNYKDIVLDDTKDVLIEFYAPWCGHCKALAPNYDILGKLYDAHKDQVVIAKVDATANDVPDDIQGFPTIKMYAAGKKEAPVTYSGARTVVDLAKFVRDNGKFKIDVVDAAEEKTGEKAEEKAEEKTEKKAEEKVEEKAAEEMAEEKEEAHDEL